MKFKKSLYFVSEVSIREKHLLFFSHPFSAGRTRYLSLFAESQAQNLRENLVPSPRQMNSETLLIGMKLLM